MECEKIESVTRQIINNYDKNHINRWAKQSMARLVKTVHQNISAEELVAMFPYNPDAIIDDTILTTPPNDDALIVAKNYLECFRIVNGIAQYWVKRSDH